MRAERKKENPILDFMLGQIACLFFSVPTAALLWFGTNKNLAIWGPAGTFLGSRGFWIVLGFLAFTSALFPKFYPALMGKIWNLIIGIEKWQ